MEILVESNYERASSHNSSNKLPGRTAVNLTARTREKDRQEKSFWGSGRLWAFSRLHLLRNSQSRTRGKL